MRRSPLPRPWGALLCGLFIALFVGVGASGCGGGDGTPATDRGPDDPGAEEVVAPDAGDDGSVDVDDPGAGVDAPDDGGAPDVEDTADSGPLDCPADERLCENQQGICAGVTRPDALCADGVWGICGHDDYLAARSTYQPGEETLCDNQDNDCDGEVDEGLENCRCGNGVCDGGESVDTCPCDCGNCGDGVCSPCGENPTTCPDDCCLSIAGTAGCGDGFCLGFGCGEKPDTCPEDCATACGNGECERGENPQDCAEDCKFKVCGNFICEGGEGPESCPQDCCIAPSGESTCGDGWCLGSVCGEGPGNCPEDCGGACGNGSCDDGEDATTCPVDCGVICGNCACDRAAGESLFNCPIDCGACGDGVCSPCQSLDENSESCPADCCAPVADDDVTCDGVDDDCDDEIDEDACDDDDPCTLDVCDRDTGACQHGVREGACLARATAVPDADTVVRDETSGVEVEVPAGAVDEPTEITVTPAPDLVDKPVVGVFGDVAVKTPFNFSPDGQTFAQPIRVSIPVRGAPLNPGTTALVLYYDRVAEAWEPATMTDGSRIWGTVGPAGKNIFFETDHFSEYARGGTVVGCVPDCVGRTCGLDGCGGLCGVCPQGQACTPAGRCQTIDGCLNECADGARQCVGNGVQACGDHDDDPCTEWGTVAPCDEGTFCSRGACVAVCANECGAEGLVQCAGAGVQTCGDADGDGCLEWSAIAPCAAGEVCEAGACRCLPNCVGLQCGDDGCGGSCGDCADGEACVPPGLCACVPDCGDAACGPNGCGGECGLCPDGDACTDEGLCLGGFGKLCDHDVQCASGICLPSGAFSQRVCTETCASDCPSEWDCTVVASPAGGDPRSLCVPSVPVCEPICVTGPADLCEEGCRDASDPAGTLADLIVSRRALRMTAMIVGGLGAEPACTAATAADVDGDAQSTSPNADGAYPCPTGLDNAFLHIVAGELGADEAFDQRALVRRAYDRGEINAFLLYDEAAAEQGDPFAFDILTGHPEASNTPIIEADAVSGWTECDIRSSDSCRFTVEPDSLAHDCTKVARRFVDATIDQGTVTARVDGEGILLPAAALRLGLPNSEFIDQGILVPVRDARLRGQLTTGGGLPVMEEGLISGHVDVGELAKVYLGVILDHTDGAGPDAEAVRTQLLPFADLDVDGDGSPDALSIGVSFRAITAELTEVVDHAGSDAFTQGELCGRIECGDDGCGGSCGTCPTDWLCSAGECRPDCVSACSPGEARCLGADQVERCEDVGGFGCFEWAVAETCAEPNQCVGGECAFVPACVSDADRHQLAGLRLEEAIDRSITCRHGCQGQADVAACVDACVLDATGATPRCGGCFSSLSACAEQHCGLACSEGLSGDCDGCLRGAPCRTDLAACSGCDETDRCLPDALRACQTVDICNESCSSEQADCHPSCNSGATQGLSDWLTLNQCLSSACCPDPSCDIPEAQLQRCVINARSFDGDCAPEAAVCFAGVGSCGDAMECVSTRCAPHSGAAYRQCELGCLYDAGAAEQALLQQIRLCALESCHADCDDPRSEACFACRRVQTLGGISREGVCAPFADRCADGPRAETCDGFDEDGDGVIDEGACPCGDGICQRPGEEETSCPDDCCRSPKGTNGCGDGYCAGAACAEDSVSCNLDCSDDGDADGWNGDNDNCPEVANPDQHDLDEDGLGDPCDPDRDGDGVPDDGDGDGLPGTAPCTGGAVSGCDDNCVDVPNADQADSDGDGVGDVCPISHVCEPACEGGRECFGGTCHCPPTKPFFLQHPDGGFCAECGSTADCAGFPCETDRGTCNYPATGCAGQGDASWLLAHHATAEQHRSACLVECIDGLIPESCADACLDGRISEVSGTCLDCSLAELVCLFDRCPSQCNGPDGLEDAACQACRASSGCADEARTCSGCDADGRCMTPSERACRTLDVCLATCAPADPDCASGCFEANPAGQVPFNRINACIDETCCPGGDCSQVDHSQFQACFTGATAAGGACVPAVDACRAGPSNCDDVLVCVDVRCRDLGDAAYVECREQCARDADAGSQVLWQALFGCTLGQCAEACPQGPDSSIPACVTCLRSEMQAAGHGEGPCTELASVCSSGPSTEVCNGHDDDGDAQIDEDDVCTGGGDRDGDGVSDVVDNCPDDGNPDQINTDADTQGDACDLDDDNDGVLDTQDNCPLIVNADQADSDGDGVGDACAPAVCDPACHAGEVCDPTLGCRADLPEVVCGDGTRLCGLLVALWWETPGDPDPTDEGPDAGSDLDLHLLHPLAQGQDADGDGSDDGWYDQPFDAFWFNGSPNWGDTGTEDDDARLLRDDTDGTGPELIRVDKPQDGSTYRIGAHVWADHGFGPSEARVDVYIRGRLVWSGGSGTLSQRDLWEAASVEWPAGAVTPRLVCDDPFVIRAFTPAGFSDTAQVGVAPNEDPDQDGIPCGEDNCPHVPNADQRDSDGDGVGDACAGGCTDACTPGQTRCSGPGLETCADHDGDGCLDWGEPVPCPGGPCVSGACPCVPDCDGRSCGDDGCGGTCGTCSTGQTCQDGACVEPQPEICDNGQDDDGDQMIDCQDPECAQHSACTDPPAEICDNGKDDNGDQLVDCEDSTCFGDPSCTGGHDCTDGDGDGYGVGPDCIGPDCDDTLETCHIDCSDGDGDGNPDCAP